MVETLMVGSINPRDRMTAVVPSAPMRSTRSWMAIALVASDVPRPSGLPLLVMSPTCGRIALSAVAAADWRASLLVDTDLMPAD